MVMGESFFGIKILFKGKKKEQKEEPTKCYELAHYQSFQYRLGQFVRLHLRDGNFFFSYRFPVGFMISKRGNSGRSQDICGNRPRPATSTRAGLSRLPPLE